MEKERKEMEREEEWVKTFLGVDFNVVQVSIFLARDLHHLYVVLEE